MIIVDVRLIRPSHENMKTKMLYETSLKYLDLLKTILREIVLNFTFRNQQTLEYALMEASKLAEQIAVIM